MKPRFLFGATAVVGAFIVTGVVAYACIPIATLNLSQSTGAPGGHVTASIHQVSGADSPPVVFHWATIDGAVLATVTPADSGTTADLVIPADVAKSGDYMIIATETQKSGYETWGMPARAVIHVEVPGSPASAAGTGGASPAQTGPAGLATESGLAPGLLALIAVGTAALGLLIVGGITTAAGRGSPKAEGVSTQR